MGRIEAVCAAAVVAVCVLYAVVAPTRGHEHFVDQVINRETVDRMRAGAGYYPAMDRALRDHIGPASSVRAFRLPTAFLVWRVLPRRAVWLLFVALVGVTAWLLMRLTATPWSGPFVALYLLHVARPHTSAGFVDQYLLVELWTVPAVAGALLLWRRSRWAAAAGLALLAVAVRELAALLLIGGLLWALVWRRPWRPWALAIAGGVALVAVHAALTVPHLAAHGKEAALLGTGGARRVLTMLDVGIPGPQLVGLALWLLGGLVLARDRELACFAGPYYALPLVGLLVGRDYWGILVVPFAIAWSAQVVDRAAVRVKAAVA